MLLVEGKVRKFGLKLRIEKTKMATHIWRRTFLENYKKILFQLNFLKIQESKVCPKKVGLFQFKMGWFKLKAGTNLGRQNYMYLSAPEYHKLLRLDRHVHFSGPIFVYEIH